MPCVSTVKDVSLQLLRVLNIAGGVSVELVMYGSEVVKTFQIGAYSDADGVFEATYILSPLVCPVCGREVKELHFCRCCRQEDPRFCSEGACWIIGNHWLCGGGPNDLDSFAWLLFD